MNNEHLNFKKHVHEPILIWRQTERPLVLTSWLNSQTLDTLMSSHESRSVYEWHEAADFQTEMRSVTLIKIRAMWCVFISKGALRVDAAITVDYVLFTRNAAS